MRSVGGGNGGVGGREGPAGGAAAGRGPEGAEAQAGDPRIRDPVGEEAVPGPAASGARSGMRDGGMADDGLRNEDQVSLEAVELADHHDRGSVTCVATAGVSNPTTLPPRAQIRTLRWSGLHHRGRGRGTLRGRFQKTPCSARVWRRGSGAKRARGRRRGDGRGAGGRVRCRPGL